MREARNPSNPSQHYDSCDLPIADLTKQFADIVVDPKAQTWPMLLLANDHKAKAEPSTCHTDSTQVHSNTVISSLAGLANGKAINSIYSHSSPTFDFCNRLTQTLSSPVSTRACLGGCDNRECEAQVARHLHRCTASSFSVD